MPDHIRYDLLTQQALRGVVRTVLTETAKKGLIGEHHFYISFDTQAPNVRLSERMRAQYPEEMTIILQHQFWDLKVTDEGFEVGLSFGGVPEKLSIPFEAIRGFFDPSVQFGLQFEEVAEGVAPQAPAEAKPTAKKRLSPASVPSPAPVAPVPTSVPTGAEKAEAKPNKAEKQDKPGKLDKPDNLDKPDKPDKPDTPSGGGEVVRLDRFRKK